MENKFEIGKEYEFSNNFDNSAAVIKKGVLLGTIEDDGIAFVGKFKDIRNKEFTMNFRYIREIQNEKSRFILTEIFYDKLFKAGAYYTLALNNEPYPINNILSYNAVGFKFKELDNKIYNQPIMYFSNGTYRSNIDINDNFEIIKASHVVWLNE